MKECYACSFTKINTPPWVFFWFLSCTVGTKLSNLPHIGSRFVVFFYRKDENLQFLKTWYFAVAVKVASLFLRDFY